MNKNGEVMGYKPKKESVFFIKFTNGADTTVTADWYAVNDKTYIDKEGILRVSSAGESYDFHRGGYKNIVMTCPIDSVLYIKKGDA